MEQHILWLCLKTEKFWTPQSLHKLFRDVPLCSWQGMHISSSSPFNTKKRDKNEWPICSLHNIISSQNQPWDRRGSSTLCWIFHSLISGCLSHSVCNTSMVYILVSTLKSKQRTASLLLIRFLRACLAARSASVSWAPIWPQSKEKIFILTDPDKSGAHVQSNDISDL